MSLTEDLLAVWKQTLEDGVSEVDLGGRLYRVGRSRNRGLRIVAFLSEGQSIEGIEQNPLTKSRWAQLAQEGQRIMQFSTRGRYVANVCEGTLTRYPAWRALGLPD
jgi:hypothetical protein